MDEYMLVIVVSISMLINFYIFMLFVKKSLTDMDAELAKAQKGISGQGGTATTQIKKSTLSEHDKALIHAELERRVKVKNNEIH